MHVRDLPLYDYREALRPSTRLGPTLRKRLAKLIEESAAGRRT